MKLPINLRLLGIVLVVAGMCSFFYSLLYFERLKTSSPIQPLPEQGKTYQKDDHGHYFYVTKGEETIFTVLCFGGWGVTLCGSLIRGFTKSEEAFKEKGN